MYTIRIDVTQFDNLSFNGKCINKKVYQDIISNLEIHDTDFIESIFILYKETGKKITTKTLVFVCDQEITELQFIQFFDKMKKVGFQSNNDKNIYFTDYKRLPNERELFIYKFTSCDKVDIVQTKKSHIKNNSRYKTSHIYKRINSTFTPLKI
jgi:hypothetical protein